MRTDRPGRGTGFQTFSHTCTVGVDLKKSRDPSSEAKIKILFYVARPGG